MQTHTVLLQMWNDMVTFLGPAHLELQTSLLLVFLLSLGMMCKSGFLELMPQDFPDPYRQKQRRLLCFAMLYRMFVIMLL